MINGILNESVVQAMFEQKELPIGIEDFKVLIDNNYYYVDKTRFLCELTRNIGKVNLFTRPRRFGKTLNLSMIQRFFEKTDEDNAYLFDGLEVSKAGEKVMAYQGKYPVVTLSLKGMKMNAFEDAIRQFGWMLSQEFHRHSEIMNAECVTDSEKTFYHKIADWKAEIADYCVSVQFLTNVLMRIYGQKTILLIDEYDVPLENAHFCGFYDKMIDFIRSVFNNALKTNSSLEMAVLTGCLRVSKESLFTGLNNLRINSILTKDYSEYFGFTEQEIADLTTYYDLDGNLLVIKEWYDGYRFGDTEIYNPWSVLNYMQDARASADTFPMPYWSNTSSNEIIRQLITESDEDTRDVVEGLVNGGSVTAPIHEDMVYADIDVNQESIWSFLLFTGYLKPISSHQIGNFISYDLVIPNREICSIYQRTILQWFNDATRMHSRADLLSALLSQDTEQINQIVSTWLNETISFYDEKEQYYHGFMAGLLSGFKGYKLRSNRESGKGRPDLMLMERMGRKTAIVIEIKAADPKNKSETLKSKLQEAFEQIEENQYEEELRNEGCQNILLYGAAFREKDCLIGLRQDPNST